jgi:hypothetical protein
MSKLSDTEIIERLAHLDAFRASGMRHTEWVAARGLARWEVVALTGSRSFSPSGFGGTPEFWCRAAGDVPLHTTKYAQDARADGCVAFAATALRRCCCPLKKLHPHHRQETMVPVSAAIGTLSQR